MNDEYAAGLIDGEGYIGIQETGGSFQVRLKVSMTDKGLPALHALRKMYGGKVEPDRGATATNRASHTWRLTGESAASVIRRLRHLLLVKGAAADVALEFDAMLTAAPKRPNRGRCWTDEMRERAAMLKLRIQEANRRGPNPEPPTLPDARPLAIYRWGWWWEPEDDLFGPVEFEGQLPMNGQMISGHVYERPPVRPRSHGGEVEYLPTPVASEGTKPSNTMGVARRQATGQVFLTNVIVSLCGLDPSEQTG